jgi:PIN domain nuclease of toxin-antitoxin system
MKILVDTHVALWLFNDYENLTKTASDCLRDEKNELYISIASAWEVAIKHSLGKLPEFNGGVKRFL